MTARSSVTAACQEAYWWLALAGRAVRRVPGHAAVAVGLSWLFGWPIPALWLVCPFLLVVGLRAWSLVAPLAANRLMLGPLRRFRRRVWVRWHWPRLATACGLGGPPARPHGLRRAAHDVVVPRLSRITTDGGRLAMYIRPLMGQTVATFTQAGEQLRMATGASRLRVDPEGPNRVLVTLTIGDSLAEPFAASRPLPGPAPILSDVVMGRCEDGEAWRLPVGPHTLVAGVSGSGKGSVFWSFAFGLAPAVREGSVQLHGVDLKGGMEILMGADLFTSRATDAAEAVLLLETLVEQMRARTREYAGSVRSHVATVDAPLHVVMIDELAALTAYCPERDLQRRAEMAVNLLCSQGRAPGFVVFACLQDPRKEVIPSRGLFTQMVGLRLKDASETTMVLGESAVASGALCHRITRGAPGTGYVVPEEGGFPIRVRAGFVADAEIRAVAAEFATPVTRSIVAPPAQLERQPRSRRARPPGSEVA